MKSLSQRELYMIELNSYPIKAQLKLPKQWNHWLYCIGLYPTDRYKKTQSLYYKGLGFRWRIALTDDRTSHVFQRGDTCEQFDRWALSDIVECNIPKTFVEFQRFVEQAIVTNVTKEM